jgi:hypothetical protein
MMRFPARAHLLVVGAYLALAVVMTWPLVLQMGSALPDIGEDGWKTFWDFWWVRHALLDLQTWPLQTPMLYAPTGTPLNFDQLALANDLIVLPLLLLCGGYPAYNLAILLWFTLSGYAGYLLNRYLLRRALPFTGHQNGRAHLAAFIGGLVFAFAPTQLGRVVGGGQMLMAVQWLALFILFTLMAAHADRFNTKHVALAGLCFALAALTDWYQPLWAGFWLALFVPLRAWEMRRGGRVHFGESTEAGDPPLRAVAAVVARVGGSVVAGLLLLSPVLYGMLNSLLTWGSGSFASPYDQYVSSSADLLAFITPPERHPLLGALVQPLTSRFTESFFEHTVYIGYAVLALCVIGLRAFWRAARFWLASALLFTVYILGPILHIAGQEVFYPLPFEAFYRLVPVVAQFTRSVSRGDSMVMLCLSVVAAFGAYRLGAWRWAWLLPLLIAFEYLWIPLPSTALAVPDYYKQLAAEQGDFAIMRLPIEYNRREDMFFQTVHGKRMTAGFTSRAEPSTWLMRVPVLQNFRQRGYDVIAQDLRTIAPSVLRDLGVRYIIVDYAQMTPPSDELYYWQDHSAELVGDAPPIYRDAWLAVYTAPPVTRAVPYLRLETGWGVLDPENWGTSQAEGWRPLANRAGLTVVAPAAQTLRVRFKAKAAQGARLTLSAGGKVIGQYTLTADAQTFTSAPFPVAPGDNRIDIAHDAAPYGARLTKLDTFE